jgi:hypothetical protein
MLAGAGRLEPGRERNGSLFANGAKDPEFDKQIDIILRN